jgi:hypothetical protein
VKQRGTSPFSERNQTFLLVLQSVKVLDRWVHRGLMKPMLRQSCVSRNDATELDHVTLFEPLPYLAHHRTLNHERGGKDQEKATSFEERNQLKLAGRAQIGT